jgi:hypothetical protein
MGSLFLVLWSGERSVRIGMNFFRDRDALTAYVVRHLPQNVLQNGSPAPRDVLLQGAALSPRAAKRLATASRATLYILGALLIPIGLLLFIPVTTTQPENPATSLLLAVATLALGVVCIAAARLRYHGGAFATGGAVLAWITVLLVGGVIDLAAAGRLDVSTVSPAVFAAALTVWFVAMGHMRHIARTREIATTESASNE